MTEHRLRFAQGSGGHYTQSVLMLTQDPAQLQWLLSEVWNTHTRMTDWNRMEEQSESDLNQRCDFIIPGNHDEVTPDSLDTTDHVLFLADGYQSVVWDFVANGDWRNWRMRQHTDPQLFNAQWSESAQCTAIDWVMNPVLNRADYERLCGKFDLTPCDLIEDLHEQYHLCRRNALAQYKQWWDSQWETVNTQTAQWYKMYDL